MPVQPLVHDGDGSKESITQLSPHQYQHSANILSTRMSPTPATVLSTLPSFGDPSGITFLLSDHKNFGYAERSCYHFDLAKTLTCSPQKQLKKKDTIDSGRDTSYQTNAGDLLHINNNINNSYLEEQQEEGKLETNCGVVRLLECVSQPSTRQAKKKHNRRLLRRIREFNEKAERFFQRKSTCDGKEQVDSQDNIDEDQATKKLRCYQPTSLPQHVSFTTRVAFAYEVTSMVLCLDASSTMTATFGNLGSGDETDCVICPMDRLYEMVGIYFHSLVKPIDTGLESTKHVSLDVTGKENNCGAKVPSSSKRFWTPEIAVTVIAVFPADGSNEKSSMLVRDFRVNSTKSASLLSNKVADWAMTEIESKIMLRSSATTSSLVPNIHDSAPDVNVKTSLRKILNTCNQALETLPPEGRPCIVVATDCRCVTCECVLDLARDSTMTDIPLHVLDLSSNRSHRKTNHSWDYGTESDTLSRSPSPSNQPLHNTIDNDGPSSFPLHISDDSEALHNACKATGGCFIDMSLIREASLLIAGQVPPKSSFHNDYYFSFQKRTLKPNAIQWYTIFSLSPCCPLAQCTWGQMPAPDYIRLRHLMLQSTKDSSNKSPANNLSLVSIHGNYGTANVPKKISVDQGISRDKLDRMKFAEYFLDPVRLKSIILMRYMDGYRSKRYGYKSQDADKVTIHFILPLEFGAMLHYELNYVASPYHNPFVGRADVEIFMSGSVAFLQRVKFYSQSQNHLRNTATQYARLTMAEKYSVKICRYLNWIKEHDHLESGLCPLEGEEKLFYSGSDFLKILGKLTKYQRYRHFRSNKFEVICTGRQEVVKETLFGFCVESGDNEEKDLFERISSWSDHKILENRFIKKLPLLPGGLISYCLVVVVKADVDRMYSIHMDFFDQVDADFRISVFESLKKSISSTNLTLPMKSFSHELFRCNQIDEESSIIRYNATNTFRHHETWKLLHDTDLKDLIRKRRTNSQIGKFWLLEDKQFHSIFAKLVNKSSHSRGPFYLVQYHIQILPQLVRVDMFMDVEISDFSNRPGMLFCKLYKRLKESDQKCGRALRSRRKFLSMFDKQKNKNKEFYNEHTTIDDVQRLLSYSSKMSQKFRFFNKGAGSANTILEELTSKTLLFFNLFETQVVQLDLNRPISIGGMEKGNWFLIHDIWHVFILVHIPTQEKSDIETGDDENSYMYREITFYQNCIADLYCTKADLADDDSLESNDTDDQKLSQKIIISLEKAHKYNYAKAAYLALRNSLSVHKVSFCPFDFDTVMSCCVNIKITEGMFISKMYDTINDDGGLVSETGLKLASLISSLLSPVPGGDNYFYFTGDDGDDFIEEAMTSNHEIISSILGSINTTNTKENNESQSNYITKEEPPLFISFTLDRKAVSSLEDISSLKTSSTLIAYLSVFDSKKELSKIHLAIASLLVFHLNSFVAEQTLALLLHGGKSLDDVDINLVKCCLSDANNVIISSVEIHFYVTKTGLMINASVPSVMEGVRQGFILMSSCLEDQEDMKMRQVANGDFFVINMESSGWCRVLVPKDYGEVRIHVYHPSGKDSASNIADKLQAIIRNACHRTNQIILLSHLHKSKTANSLLIPEDNLDNTAISETSLVETTFLQGHFQPNVIHKISYKIHRCTVVKAISSLQSSVLRNFAVSNRRGVFVYRGEESSVFYMKLEGNEGTNGESNSVNLLVFGEDEAVPISITKQLNHLLQKKIMSISLDILSSVLTKNPEGFRFEKADIMFLTTFQQKMNLLENKAIQNQFNEEHYIFPSIVSDPVMVLVYFKQNILGSTFFHAKEGYTSETFIDNSLESSHSNEVNIDSEITFNFNYHDFSLYFNASPSQLDPNFQPVSTLTDVGEKLSREAGTGVALIEIRLLRSDINQVEFINTGTSLSSITSCKKLQFRKVIDKTKCEFDKNHKFQVSIRIVNTTLNTVVLHRWIEMTLNQSLSGWFIECQCRVLQQNNLLLDSPKAVKHVSPPNQKVTECNKLEVINEIGRKSDELNKLCYSLSSLGQILQSTCKLPHPAVKNICFRDLVKSATISKITYHFLDKGLECLFNKKKHRLIDGVKGLRILRLNGRQKPKRVSFCYGSNENDVGVYDVDTSAIISDGPMDSPTYLCIYVSEAEISNNKDANLAVPVLSSFLFDKVFVEEKVDDKNKKHTLSYALKNLKSMNKSIFTRHIVLLMSVKKEKREILFYNWNPLNFQITSNRLKEVHTDILLTERKISFAQEKRCFKNFSIGKFGEVQAKDKERRQSEKKEETVETLKTATKNSSKISLQTISENSPNNVTSNISQAIQPIRKRRARKPITILKPTLVGRSVDGDVAKAMAKSRSRASFSRASTVRSLSGSRIKTPTNATIGIQSDKGQHHKLRESSTSQKVKSSSHQIDTIDAKGISEKKHTCKDHLLKSVLKHFPVLNINEYCSVQLHISSSRLGTAVSRGMVQRLLSNWIKTVQWNKLPREAIDIVLTHSTAIWLYHFPVIQFAAEKINSFLTFLAQSITNEQHGSRVLFKDDECKTMENTFKSYNCYILKEIECFRNQTAYFIFKLTVYNHPFTGLIACCQSWLFISSEESGRQSLVNNGKKMMKLPTSEKQTRYLGKAEKEAFKRERITHLALMTLRLKSAVFNYAIILLRRACSPQNNMIQATNIPKLLKETNTRFPLSSQIKLVDSWHRLLYRKVNQPSLVNVSESVRSSAELIKYICSKTSKFGVFNCSSCDELCISGIIDEHACDIHFFLLPNKDNQFDLFTLCYSMKDKFPYNDTLSNSISTGKSSELVLHTIDIHVQKIINKAVIDLRYSILWKKYSLCCHVRKCNDAVKEILEMCSLSRIISIQNEYPQLDQILSDEENQLNLNWEDILSSIRQNSYFSRGSCFKYRDHSEQTLFLFYFKEENIFLLFELKSNEQLRSSIISRRGDVNTDNIVSIRNAKVIQKFTNWVLCWIWNSVIS